MQHDIEILKDFSRGEIHTALLDFDGTLSLIRRGWQQVMVGYFVDVLRDCGSGESRPELTRLVEDFVAQLTGKQTIYQAIRLAEEVAQRGGRAEDPLYYKHAYHDRLWQVIRDRVEGLEKGEHGPDQWLLPGSRDLLENLKGRGVRLYLASGTDLQFVQKEAELLQISHYFDGGIYGALDDYRRFSKAMVIQRIFEQFGLSGSQLLGIGDGYVEIENIKQVGGIAVGVASNEMTGQGIDSWKRGRLRLAGADLIIPEFRHQALLLKYLFNEIDLSSCRE